MSVVVHLQGQCHMSLVVDLPCCVYSQGFSRDIEAHMTLERLGENLAMLSCSSPAGVPHYSPRCRYHEDQQSTYWQ